jgi:hypothetical protein
MALLCSLFGVLIIIQFFNFGPFCFSKLEVLASPSSSRFSTVIVSVVLLFKPANLTMLIFLLYNIASTLLQTVKGLSSAVTISMLLLSFQNIITWCKEDGTTQFECIQSLHSSALYADFVFTTKKADVLTLLPTFI